ncbi:hypothetical protein [Calidifontibacter indicus]|uniref:hypothetical protein n=1 Tax=Calidifontibacter indicus TaxID=419650 RepID=UPI003D747829
MATIGSEIPTLGTSTRVGTQPVPRVPAIAVGRLLSVGFGTTVGRLAPVEPLPPAVLPAPPLADEPFEPFGPLAADEPPDELDGAEPPAVVDPGVVEPALVPDGSVVPDGASVVAEVGLVASLDPLEQAVRSSEAAAAEASACRMGARMVKS